MLSYHKSVDAADYDTLYHYVESGQVNEARETLDEVCRERRLSSSGNQFKKLLLAAERTGQISMIKLLLEHEPDYRTEFSDEKLSALCIAILYGHLDSAELLLRSGSVEVNGADLEARDYRGRTALHCAVSQGRVREAKLLLDKGADVNVSDCEGETPLLAAAQSSEADELLPLLMKRGADATAKDLWGRNALHNLTCAPGDHVDLARVLIEKGVSLGDRESLFEHQPIHTAAFLKKDKLVKLYLEHGTDLKARDSKGRTILHYAVKKGRVQVTEWLLEKGADVNVAAHDTGVTPLLAAALSSKADELLPLLMKHGADATAKDVWGRNALHNLTCAPGDHVDLARVLIEKGVSLDDRESLFEHQPIHKAVFLKKNELVKLYLEHGTDLKARDSKGRTILHYATKRGHVQVTEWLLEEAADVNARDGKGKTPLLIGAASSVADELVPLLMKYGADLTAKDSKHRNVLHLLALAPEKEEEHVELARVLIGKGVPLDERLAQFHPIHMAVHLESNALVNFYLDLGVDVNMRAGRDYDCLFPLFLAASGKNPAVVQTLIKRGASLHLTRHDGYTALHKACASSQRQNIELLLSAGADIFAVDNFGNTVLDAAIMNTRRRKPCIRLILKWLAMIRDREPSIAFKCEWVIDPYSERLYYNYYEYYFEEIPRLKSTRFIETCSFYELLTKSSCAIAKLMRHHEFETKFRMYDLKKISMYREDILRVFERAKRHHQSRLEQEDVINEAVYNIFPDLVMRRIVHYIFDCCWNV